MVCDADGDEITPSGFCVWCGSPHGPAMDAKNRRIAELEARVAELEEECADLY